ncbi:hypothetical protein HMPREF3190_00956 [Umbribacter vaginalis]|nr:hypothetical protein HMPREF3190_00956 [Coriobacteriales bacterium DNF00809]
MKNAPPLAALRVRNVCTNHNFTAADSLQLLIISSRKLTKMEKIMRAPYKGARIIFLVAPWL